MEDMQLYLGDCLYKLRDIPDKSIDLVVTDPPYQIDNTKAGGNSSLSRSIQYMNDEIEKFNLTEGFNTKVLDECVRVLKKINMYIWCNGKQIPMYLDYFVKELGCAFDILVWVKTNAVPTFNNKYLTDKEYCLYFRKNGYCQPTSYDNAKTAWFQPINAKDKDKYGHPTIKPLNIIERLVENSSLRGGQILDPFMGSGTTGVACAKLGRKFIGMEINERFYNIAKERIEIEMSEPTLF